MTWLLALSAALALAIFWHGAVLPSDWAGALFILGLTSLVYWLRTARTDLAPHVEGWLKWPVVLLIFYSSLQLLPLPHGLLCLLSPARAELLRAVQSIAPTVHYAPLSLVPHATQFQVLRLVGYALVFFLVRELAWRNWERPWRIAVPIVVVATAQAVLGMAQYLADPVNAQATGTYVNRNHFAGLLEMALPFAVMHAAIILHRNRSRHHSPAGPALRACVLLGCAGLMLAAAIYSLSRMGFVAALFGLLVTGLLAAGRRLSRPLRRSAAVAVFAALFLAVVFLPPDRLVERFSPLAAGEISADTRAQIWRDTAQLIREYPLTGSGLGSFGSAFARYQQVAPLNTVDYAHNDYLQCLAELGILGSLIVLVWVGAMARKTAQALAPHRHSEERYLALACAGAMSAIALHSLVDFNLYIPANAMLLSWICGIVAGLPYVSQRASHKQVIDTKAVSSTVRWG